MSQTSSATSRKKLTTLPALRRTELLRDGSYLFEDELMGGVIDAVVITCAAWLLELYKLDSGDVAFTVGKDSVRPATNSFGVFYASFSLTRPRFKNPRGRLVGIAGTSKLPNDLLKNSLVFDTNFSLPGNAAEAIEVVRTGANRQVVGAFPAASLLSLKAKRLIDENHLSYPSIGRIAERLGISHSHLSRQFKSDFGMSPIEYLRRLRVADAPLKLARGEEIVDVSLEVGYNDLSRFYKQFRKTTNTSPGVCKTLLRPRR